MVEASPQLRVLGAVAVLDVGRHNMDRQQQTEGVRDDEALTALHLLAGVESPGGDWDGVGGPDRLRVDQRGAGLGVAAVGLTDMVPEGVMEPPDRAVVVPPGEVPVHRGPRREVLRQLPPGAACPHHVEDRVHDPASWVLLPPAAFRPHPCRRQQRLDQLPLFIRQIRRIAPTSHMRLNDHPDRRARKISNTV